jgi:IclR family transcriptional regulator, KDG regulon repressor
MKARFSMTKLKTKAKARSAADDTAGATGRYKVEAVARAALVLEAFRRSPGAVPVEALAKRTGLAEPGLEALLATLERRGLVRRLPGKSGHVALGLMWLRLADVKRRQLEIRQVALPVMRHLRDTVGETVSLGIRIGSSRVNIEYAESRHEVRRITQPGYHVPLHQGAGGRTILSALDDAAIDAYLATTSLTQFQKTKLISSIKAARRDGYAVVDSEVTSDTAAISAPIHDNVGDVAAVLTISLPSQRLTPQMRTRAVREVMKGAREVSIALGYDAARAA